jgi:glycosyltransferase involved in cell wall biosynthesis
VESVENSTSELPPLPTVLGNPAKSAGFPHSHSAGDGCHIDTTFKILLREATVLWLPSEGEGLPVACIEAMATGVPVIGFDVPGVSDLLKGGCGVLVPPGNAAKLADETLALLHDPARYRKIARAARARVENEYSLERMCAAHYSLMRQISGAGGRPGDGSLSRGFHTRKSPRQKAAGVATLTK